MSVEYEIQGLPISSIAQRFGTPLYVYDGEVLRQVYQELRGLLTPQVELFYSLKANPNISIVNMLREMGARAEVCSLAELHTAVEAGVDPQHIIFLGPGKSDAEITACIRYGIYAIVTESFQELERIEEIAAHEGRMMSVALRVNPSFSVKGSRLTMGGKPRQFGIDEQSVLQGKERFEKYTHIEIMGLHVYMGTRMLEIEPIVENTRHILELAERIENELDITLRMVDVGGGLGVPYHEGEQFLDISELTEQLNPMFESFQRSHKNTRLFMELGRYLVGTCGMLVSRALYVKPSYGEKFVVTDGGTNCHMAAVGTGSYVKRNFPIASLTRYGETPEAEYNITGPLCTPNDVVGKRVSLPPVEQGDLLGVFHSGAYGPTASPTHFLSHGSPAEVLIVGGEAFLIRERDTPEDLLGKQRLVQVSPTPITN
ncbi:diaminopimelate decarboxylase [Paenibacillus silvae]|uniref:diaminopimelate decarboxylase n=1 Tax=Paenibacillus silvae TaxID=1325358 RepID=UPI0020040733|nr:diaminopimelate decarboxylase [Paenibacillus silvae]MCK6151409.1 diaminopimelate decarboxylase [Paenibacillus silvae]MCK6269898.1 diaminopimelate decarboxylase [Paenibacillus silvae]